MIEAIKVIEDGVFQEERVRKVMVEDPARFPGCQGTRTYQDNLTDIKAQAAANNKGSILVSKLIKEYTLETVMVS